MNHFLALIIKLYRTYCFYSSPYKMLIRRATKFFTDQGPKDRILEIGGGNAMIEKILSSVCKPSYFISTDIDPSERTHLVCDAQMLPFGDKSFDLIVAFEVIEHVPNTNLFISEIYRTLQNKGFLFLSMPFVYGEHDYMDFYRWTPKGVEALFSQYHFKMLKIYKCGGTCLTIVTLLVNYVYHLFAYSRSGWRSRASGKMFYHGFMTILLSPLMVLSWMAYLMDLIIDRDSANASDYVLILQKDSLK